MLQTTDLYQPIAADLRRVGQLLRGELRSDLPCVTRLCAQVERYAGKMLRPAVVLLGGQACGGAGPQHVVLGAVVEMVHLATLVHDDVLDDAELRRGRPTVHRDAGNAAAVLLGDFLFSRAFRLCSTLDSPLACQLIGRTAATLCEGELLQIAHRGRLDLSEATYLDIIARKTAALVRTSAELAAHYAGADGPTIEALARYGHALGMAFQIADDLLDLTGEPAALGKPVGRDADLGELTLPIIHFLRTAPSAAQEAMRGALRDPSRGAEVGRLLAASDSLDYARDAARGFVAAATAELAALPESEARDALIATAEFVLARRR